MKRSTPVITLLTICAVSGAASARVGVTDADDSASRPVIAPRQKALQLDGVRLWAGPDGVPLPMWNDEELVEFLRTAEVIEKKQLGEGVNRPLKVLLERGGVQMHAIFREVNEEIDRVELAGKRLRFFRDKYIFECAAYELSRLVGIDSVPPAIVRRLDGRRGSLQVWVEDAMTESKRRKRSIKPPDVQRWNRQIQTMRLWDNLVHNMDRNTGNILIDRFWQGAPRS